MDKQFEELLRDLGKLKSTRGCVREEKIFDLIAQGPVNNFQRAQRMQFLIEATRENLHVDSLTRAMADAISDDFDALGLLPDCNQEPSFNEEIILDKPRTEPLELVELCYASKATKPLTPEELSEIAEYAAAYNEQHNITGILYYDEKQHAFMQILEGGEKPLRKLMKEISTDKRHKEIILRSKYKIRNRSFGDFAMMLKTCTELQEKSEQYSDFSEWMSDELQISKPDQISKSAQWFLEQIRTICLRNKSEVALMS